MSRESRCARDFCSRIFMPLDAFVSTVRPNSTKMFKPFKPPLLKKAEKPMSVDLTGSDLDLKSQLPPNKNRRLLVHYVPDSPPKPFPTSTAAVSTPRKPLLVINNSIKSNDSSSTASDGPEGYYMVLWCAKSRTLLVKTNAHYAGVSLRLRNIRPGMGMEYSRFEVDMPVCKIYQVEIWDNVRSEILCCLEALSV
jgi:hypothetical protein